jgi:UPF0755 protein
VSDVGLDLGPQRPRRPAGRRLFGCLAVLLSLAILLGGGYLVYSFGLSALKSKLAPPPDYDGDGTGRVVVQVHDGDAATDIAATLVRKHVVKSADAFTHAAREDPRAVGIQAGFYAMRKKMSAKSALAILVNHDNRIHNVVTVREGLRVDQIVAVLAAHTRFSERQFARVLRHPARLHLPSYADGNPEGYLFPATYEVTPDATPLSLLSAMVDRYRQAVSQLHIESRAGALGQSPHDVMTVASIVQVEGKRPQDLPKIARVLYNRLKRGKPLQLDSTVAYIFKTRGRLTTTSRQRASSSPYNTYKHTGLPPTPISAPGEAAITAALRPADGSWLYFVTTNPDTGATSFATTYAEHLKNVRKFRAYCRSHTC